MPIEIGPDGTPIQTSTSTEVKTPVSTQKKSEVKTEVKRESVAQKKSDKQEILETLNAIIAEYEGEGNIPLNHDYWKLVNHYRSLK